MAKQESSLGRSGRAVLVTQSWSLGPYRPHTKEDGEREVEVVEESEHDSPRSLLLAGSSLLSNYAHQKANVDILGKENSQLKKENNDLKVEIDRLRQENLELKAKQAAPSGKVVSIEQDDSSNELESDMGLSYDELQKMNTVKEPVYQTGQDSDASSVDEMTGQEPTLAELLSMNPVGD